MSSGSARIVFGITNIFFARCLDGGTEVRDLVTYVPPLGPFGVVLNRLVIRPQLERIFDYRAAHLPRESH